MSGDIQYINPRGEPAGRRSALMQEFYDRVYRYEFPKLDQAEGPDVWLPLMGNHVPRGQPEIHAVLACDDARNILGGALFEFYPSSACWLATYIVVRPDARRRGVGRALIARIVDTIAAREATDWVLFAETENPALISDRAGWIRAKERLHILDTLGMRQVPIEYVQPPLGPGKRALEDLILLCYAPDAGRIITAVRVAAFLAEFFGALQQPNSPHLSRMLAKLAKQALLQPTRLI